MKYFQQKNTLKKCKMGDILADENQQIYDNFEDYLLFTKTG